MHDNGTHRENARVTGQATTASQSLSQSRSRKVSLLGIRMSIVCLETMPCIDGKRTPRSNLIDDDDDFSDSDDVTSEWRPRGPPKTNVAGGKVSGVRR